MVRDHRVSRKFENDLMIYKSLDIFMTNPFSLFFLNGEAFYRHTMILG